MNTTVTPPTVDEIFTPPPVDPAKTPTRELLALGIELLACTTDPLAAQYLERALPHMADLADELATANLTLSEALTISHARYVEVLRLRERNRDLIDLARGGDQ